MKRKKRTYEDYRELGNICHVLWVTMLEAYRDAFESGVDVTQQPLYDAARAALALARGEATDA